MKSLLTEKDHNELDNFLGRVLDQHKTGHRSRTDAIGDIAQVVAALDEGNIGEVRSQLANALR